MTVCSVRYTSYLHRFVSVRLDEYMVTTSKHRTEQTQHQVRTVCCPVILTVTPVVIIARDVQVVLATKTYRHKAFINSQLYSSQH